MKIIERLFGGRNASSYQSELDDILRKYPDLADTHYDDELGDPEKYQAFQIMGAIRGILNLFAEEE